jgi:predicted deacylase
MIPLTSQADLAYRAGVVGRFNWLVSRLPDGSPVFIPVQLICGERPGPRMAVVAGVHGDELEGVRAIHALMAEVQPTHLAGTLILVPVVNVMAFNACARRSPVDNVDLNRVFPGNPAGSISERLADRLCRHLLAGCDLVISLHGWLQNGTLEPWMEFVDVPGPLGVASHAAAHAFGIPDLVPLPLLPGRLISALAGMGVPAIEGEVGGQAMFSPAGWRIYEQGLRRILTHMGMASQPDANRAAKPATYWALRGVFAPVGGLMHPHVAPGERVRQGQTLATVSDLFGQTIAEIAAPGDGKISSLQTVGTVQPGAQLFTLLEPTTPSHVPLTPSR